MWRKYQKYLLVYEQKTISHHFKGLVISEAGQPVEEDQNLSKNGPKYGSVHLFTTIESPAVCENNATR